MVQYIVKRLFMLVPVLFGVSILVFLLMRVFSPDPAAIVLGEHASSESIREWRESNGLNKPIERQYLDYMRGIFRGDLGNSYYTKSPVIRELAVRLPATIELSLVSIGLATLFGILFGVLSAIKKNTLIDRTTMVTALLGVSMPVFWTGILLIILFAGVLHIFPSSGRIDPLMKPLGGGTGFYLLDTLWVGDFEAFGNTVQHIVLPGFTLSLYSLSIITRMTRAGMLESMEQDYIRTARAKGLAEGAVIWKHGFRNTINPVITVVGLQFGSLLSGAMLTETVFSWPGIGSYTVDAILKSDFPIVQGSVLIVALIFVLLNLGVDVIYAFLDPRIKYVDEDN
ncbi:MAG: ABC transporter permease [Treponema sp.]|jgi:peptide/nickel transport system permease protein|nr:ABC transporter permease [Treponema sp.]